VTSYFGIDGKQLIVERASGNVILIDVDTIDSEIKELGEDLVTQSKQDEFWAKLFDDEVKTYVETDDRLRVKAKKVAKMLKESKHCVIYTGAGISTSAKIPDYRGPEGVWTLSKKGVMAEKSFSLSQAYPTYAHYAITELVKRGIVKYIVSTNMDGLHRRSGIKEDKISEVHGNCYREICVDCHDEYLRGFDVLLSRSDRWTHRTGRFCTFCGGDLRDTIVHFTEHMEDHISSKAVENSRKADLALVLGTSMNVQPAASYPPKVNKNPGGKFVLVNIQKTPYDDELALKVYGKTDEFMQMVMEELGIPEVSQSHDGLRYLMERDAEIEEKKEVGKRWITLGFLAAFTAVIVGSSLRS
jgi:mono-ADP-ribosyltransferase sirtuin 6